MLVCPQLRAQEEISTDTLIQFSNGLSVTSITDSVPLIKYNQVFEQKWDSISRRLSKDTLSDLKDSIYASFISRIKKDSALIKSIRKDSLTWLMRNLPKRDAVLHLFSKQLRFDSTRHNKDSLFKRLKDMPEEQYERTLSSFRDKLKGADTKGRKSRLRSWIPYTPESPESYATMGGGYINYNYMFRSALDTPFVETGIGQHMITAGLDFSVAELPFRLTYYGRQSNSQFLRDYHDFRIEFNAPEFRRLQQQQLRKKLLSTLQDLQPADLTDNIQAKLKRLRALRNILGDREWQNLYLQSKRYLTYRDQLPMELPDQENIIRQAELFVNAYESKQALQKTLEYELDSLESVYRSNARTIQQLQRVVNRNIYTEQGTRLIQQEMEDAGIHDRKTKRLLNAMYAVRTFAVGRTLPRMTALTVNNISVGGINFEYNANDLYLALTAGKIDFRSRDFLYGKPSPVKQYVYAGSVGYGLKEGSHLILTGYSGRKQIISANQAAASPVSGMSLEGQWAFSRNIRITAEVAQSTSPLYAGYNTSGKSQGFRFNDNSNKAYAFRGLGYIPSTQTRFEAYYQKTGINFQNFSNYRVNANNSTWSIKVDQYLWRRQIRLMASARKNDFSNPFIVQQYSSNTIFTTLSATFRMRNLPALTVGYLPSSQYTVVDGQVAESRYQTLNVQMSHAYRIGLMRASGNIMYNKFYNSGNDTAFIYYNASHFYTAHQFAFPMFTGNVGFARTQNGYYSLSIMEGGLSITWFKKVIAGFGVKINNYNTNEVKTGAYFNFRCSWKLLGDFNFWYERGYLPGSAVQLMKNEWLTIGFTRYFNNKIKL